MKIVIIGGSGFVGTCLIDSLVMLSDVELVNIDIKMSLKYPALTVQGDIMDYALLKEQFKGADWVVLLAAEHRDDVKPVQKYYDVNVEGMRNTLRAMENAGVKKILFTSSVAVYGLNKNNPSEISLVDPFNDYGKSKFKAEQALNAWYRRNPGGTAQVIRPTVIFGEGNRGNVFNLLKQIASGRFLMIGSGTNVKSMSYVGNVVAFIQYLISVNDSGYQIYNYSDTPDFSTNSLVQYTGEVLGKRGPAIRIPYILGLLGGYGFDVLAFLTRKKLSISSVRVRKFCATTKFNSSKMLCSGFKPPYTLEEGLRTMLLAEFGSDRLAQEDISSLRK